jgi:type IV secretory pathway VirB2 component (pilin)
MLRKQAVFQAAMILSGLVTSGLSAATRTQSSDPSKSLWDATAGTIIVSPFIGPVGEAVAVASIVVGGLMFAFAKDQSRRVLAAIVFAVGLMIGAANYLVWLFPL